jgi:hypothetical protein
MDVNELVEAERTPALDAATAEHEKVMTDPTHQHYDGFRRGDQAASDYVDGLYRKILPNYAPVEIGNVDFRRGPLTVQQEGVSTTTDLTDEARAGIDVETELRMELGAAYETTMHDMATGAQHLFAGADGEQALTVLADRVSGLGPRAELLGVRFLAELARLQSQGGMRS